jgi:predicted dehydrogenase
LREKIRVGVAGCGTIAHQVHLPLLQTRRDVNLVAIADSDERALAETAQRVHGVQPYHSLDDMLAEGGLDAVVIALPTGLHAAAACAVFDAGLHLYLEKPLATTVNDAALVMNAWRRSGRIGVMGFNCRANPLLVQMRELLRAGRAGRTVYLRTVFATAARPLPEWKRQRVSGGGALFDLGAHHIDLIRFLTSHEITGVRATMTSRMIEQETVLLELELDNGVGTQSFFSLAAAEMDHVEVHGDAARLSVARFTSLDVHIVDNPGRGPGPMRRALRRAGAVRHLGRAIRTRRAPLREPGYAVLLDHFVRGARTGAAPAGLPDIADGFACSAVIAAAELSVVTGRQEAPALPFPESLLRPES